MATELAKAYVQIVPSARGIQGSISNALGGEATSAGNSAGQSVGSNLVGKLKKIIATAGIGKVLKDTITSGADLQQSIGGIETLFKDNAATVEQYAANAYKTAGVSANSYMEQVTSFSASLLQSLGGDTAKAAESANQALTDMSDNSNKMGTSMELIQYAYQGFAKQNYTMLDNLKLGYGGTKTEMERLLSDAQKITGQKYDISNLNDVYSAIHVIQGQLDITGTTAKEAATTLSGSFNSMKAAAQNLMGNLTLGNDIGPSLSALSDTVTTFLVGNLIPAVMNILAQVPSLILNAIKGIVTLAPQVIKQFADGIVQSAPQAMQSGIEILKQIANGITTGLPQIIQSLSGLVTQFVGMITQNLPGLLDAGIQIIKALS
jgi:hypothetical protein